MQIFFIVSWCIRNLIILQWTLWTYWNKYKNVLKTNITVHILSEWLSLCLQEIFICQNKSDANSSENAFYCWKFSIISRYRKMFSHNLSTSDDVANGNESAENSSSNILRSDMWTWVAFLMLAVKWQTFLWVNSLHSIFHRYHKRLWENLSTFLRCCRRQCRLLSASSLSAWRERKKEESGVGKKKMKNFLAGCVSFYVVRW